MNPMGLIILGVLIIFGVPIGVGVALAVKVDMVAGILGGVVTFVIIVIIGYRHMMKQQGKGDHRNNR